MVTLDENMLICLIQRRRKQQEKALPVFIWAPDNCPKTDLKNCEPILQKNIYMLKKRRRGMFLFSYWLRMCVCIGLGIY